MPAPNTDVTMADGSLDFSGGVDSIKVTTIQSAQNPNGLNRNELAWLDNGQVRDGGVSPRSGWQPIGRLMAGSAVYQGGFMYSPDNANPYLVVSIGGHILKFDPASPGSVTDLSVQFGLYNPAGVDYAWFCQAEQFLIIQAGDYGMGGPVVPGTTDGAGNTLPLFWDGVTLRRSKGIANTAVPPGTPGVNEIPAGTCMDYYMNRLWYAQYRTYSAGDIVGGTSGTGTYHFRDSVLNVTENPLVVGGDGFTVPTDAGNIRALKHNANLDTALGQGLLFVFTRRAIYALSVPVTRGEWLNSTKNNMPQQTVVQLVNGSVNDRSVTPVNGDLFYQSLEPGIRSLISAIRYFTQWGNVQISSNEERILQFTDRSLLRFASGIEFNNRMLQTALPKRIAQGVVHPALIPLDFTPISTFGATASPVWEGMYEGLNFLQLFTGDFGGEQRAFAMVVSEEDSSFNLWELTWNDRYNNGQNRITFVFESPAYTWGQEFQLKKLVSAELWLDRLYGTANIKVEYRPDGETCWYLWHQWNECCPKNSAEDPNNPISYPLQEFGESYRSTITLPLPKTVCQSASRRPSNIGYQFQARVTIHGYCRVRGLLLHANPVERKLYDRIVC